MNHYFVVCDQEEAYVEKFTALLNERKLVPYQIEGLTDTDTLETFCGSHRVEILLIEDELCGEQITKLPVGRLLRLSSFPQEDENMLFKYQSVVQMVEKIMCMPQTEQIPARNSSVELIGVYSPIRRSQKTVFALAMGQILAKERAVIYLNYQAFSGLHELLDKVGESDFADVLYLVQQGKKEFSFWKDRCVYTVNNLDYILPAVSPMDLHSAGESDFLQVLEALQDAGEYHTILLEFDESCSAFLPLLQKCDVIYMPVREDRLSDLQLLQYEQLMRQLGQLGVLQKTVSVKPPYHNGFGSKEQYVEQLIWGELGDYVRSLLWGK